MASKQTYECYVCRRNGFENVRVYLDRKTEDGKTNFKNPDMSAHIHKQGQHPSEQQQRQQQPQQQQQQLSEYQAYVKPEISAFTLMTDLIKEVEDVKKEVITVREVLDNQERLFNQMLLWTQQINKQQQQQQQPTQQQQQASTTTLNNISIKLDSIGAKLEDMDIKINHIMKMLESLRTATTTATKVS